MRLMTVILFDDSAREGLLPLTFTRPVAGIRIGILTIAEKWEKYLGPGVSYLTAAYLQQKFPPVFSDDNLYINGSVCPNAGLLEAIDKLEEGAVLIKNNIILAVKSEAYKPAILKDPGLKPVDFSGEFTRIAFPEDIFRYNDKELRADFDLLTAGRTSAGLSSTNTVLGDQIFVEEGVKAECSVFNTLQGPVYLGRNSEVWEGSAIRGSFALCHDSQVKLGSKIYGKTTIGPYCRVGGEINNSVLQSRSSKGHEGYLGNSVLGEWCNIGADSNNSNLKNNYTEVKLWDYNQSVLRDTGLQFCGLIMGDHSKCGINTMFNTGTIVGVSANIFGAGYPPKFVPDFSWGGGDEFAEYMPEKAFETAARVFDRKNEVFDEMEKNILTSVFEMTKPYRKF